MPTINLKKHNIRPVKVKHTTASIDFSFYYNSKAWRNLRAAYIAMHPLCEDCLAEGKITNAEEVHHIIPFSTGKTEQERMDLLTDENNLKSLCKTCHRKYHKPFNRLEPKFHF